MTVTNYTRGQTLAATSLDADFGRCIDRGGDAMAGLLTLAQDPIGPLDAATKQYIDNRLSPGGAFVLKSGDTMTGPLSLTGSAGGNASIFGVQGAVLNGVADDSTVFQTARNLISSGVGRKMIPAGTLNIPTPPTIPSGTFAIWDMQAHPSGGFNSYSEAFTTDVVHTVNQGEWWYQRQTSPTANQGTGPVLRADRKITHTGGTGWSLLQLNDTWDTAANPGGQFTSLNVVGTLNATVGTSPYVGIFQTAIRSAGSVVPMFGANFKIEDATGTNHNFAHIGAEYDILGNGTWTNNQAGVIDVVLKKSQSGGSAFQANFGFRVGNWTSDLTQGGFANGYLLGNANYYTAGFGALGSATMAAGAAAFDASAAAYTDTVGIAFRAGASNAIDFGPSGQTRWLRWINASSVWGFGSGTTGNNWTLDANGFNSIASVAITGSHTNIALAITSSTTVGLNTTGATFTGNAVRLATGQTIGLDTTGAITVRYDSGTTTIRFANGATDLVSINVSTGAIRALGSITPSVAP